MTLQLRPTFSESWYRVADLKPKLRGVAQISRQFYRGERWYVVRDPAGNQYHRLSDAAYAFVGLLDGHRTVAESWELVGGQLADDAPTQPEVIQILSQLYAANLIETNVPPDAQVLLRRHKKQSMQKTKMRMMNVLFPRIPLLDPDWILKMWMPLMRHVISVPGLIVWSILMVMALAAIAPYGADLRRAAIDTLSIFESPENAVLLGITFVVLKLIHEFGHGFMCRRFGGEVHEMGVMFLVLFPCPYVDASSAWLFPNKWHRFLVGAGGMIFELAVAAVACFVWVATKDTPGLIPAFAYNVMLIASVSTVVFNSNPLLRYDGYYMLSDLLELPNLQQRSKEYFQNVFKRHLFRVKLSQPLPAPNQRPWLFMYHVTAGPYRIMIGIVIMLYLLYQLPQEVKILGLFMGLASIATFFIVPLFKLFKYLSVDPELHRKRARAWAWTVAFFGLVILATTFITFPIRMRAPGVLQAADQRVLFPTSIGYVDQVLARDGDMVQAGQVLLVARNEQLETQVRVLQSRLRQSEIRFASAQAEDASSVSLAQEELDLLTDALKRERQKLDELTIRAPIDGRFVAPDIEQTVGQWLSPGKPVGMILSTGQMVVYASVSQQEYQLLSNAQGRFRTQVRLMGDVNVPINIDPQVDPSVRTVLMNRATTQARGHQVTQASGGEYPIDPQDPSGRKLASPVFEFQVFLPESASLNTPGQKAYVRVWFEDQRSLFWMGWRKLLQTIQTTRAT
jgi:putative peptide zinc metalloprotease protein